MLSKSTTRQQLISKYNSKKKSLSPDDQLNASLGSSLEDDMEESSPFGRSKLNIMKMSSRSKGIQYSLENLGILSPKFKGNLDDRRKESVTEFSGHKSFRAGAYNIQ